jgi:hypothetical protein
VAQGSDIFISYSHKDKEWLEKLQVHLKPLFPEGGISVWDDTRLQPGSLWSSEIEQALRNASAAVLLISPDFFASAFIMQVEWPELRRAARERGLSILPIAVRASAIFDTEIGAYQGLMDLARPLDQFSVAEQGAQLVSIARRIRDTANRSHVDGKPAGTPDMPLVPLRIVDTGMADLAACMFDPQGRFWVSNGQQVKVFRIDHDQPLQRWLLPNRRWKTYAPEIWAQHLVLSDWDGALYRFSNEKRDGALYAARHDSLPFHLMAQTDDGQLLAAAWDGSIRRWHADGTLAGEITMLASLPTHLAPLPDGSLAVADQASVVHLFDPGGKETWSWRFGEPLQAIWATADGGSHALAMVGARRVVKVGIGEQRAQEVAMPGRIVSVSRRRGLGDEWIVIASEGGRIDWLSMSPFNLVRDNTATVDFNIREVLALPAQDMASQHIPIAIGLTERGRLFFAEERRVHRYDEPQGIDQLLMVPSGRFLLLRSQGRGAVYRNPAISSARCRVEVAGLSGTLAVKGFKKLQIKLRNSGSVPIHHLKAELHAAGIIEPSKDTRALPLPVQPGDPIDLEFAVLAQVSGDAVPINLRLELADEGGPPLSVEELRLNVESR